MMNDYLLIIDGSSLLSTQYYGNLPKDILYAKTEEDREKLYHKLMKTTSGTYTNGIFGFLKSLFAIIKDQKPKYLAVCWDLTRDTFRREIYSEYKGNRSSTPKPLKEQFELCQKVLDKMGIKQFASMTYEADDYAGSISSKFESDVPIVIMTKDRDYLQLVDDNVSLWMMSSSKSKVLDFYKNHNVKREDYIVPEQAMYLTPELVKEEYGYTPDKTVMVKSLAGDSSDNIPGVKGVGDKIAVKLANIYNSTKDLYDSIRDLDNAGIEALKKELKDKYDLSRAPFKALLFEGDDDNLSGEESAMLSYKLATIKRDVPIDETLEDLSLNLTRTGIDEVFNELEIHSLSVDGIEASYFGEEEVNTDIEVETIVLNANDIDEYVTKANESDKVSIYLDIVDVESKATVKQLSFDDLLSGAVAESDKAIDDNPLSCRNYYIAKLSFAYENDRVYVIEADDSNKTSVYDAFYKLFTKSKKVVCYDIKSIIRLLDEDTRNSLLIDIIDSEYARYVDVMLYAYLINPLKSSYPYSEILYDHMSKAQGYDEALSLYMLSDAIEDELKSYGMDKLYKDIELPTAFVLYDMEYQGVIVDKQALNEYGDSLTAGIAELEQNIYKACGHEFNILSPKQLGVVLFEELKLPALKKTKTGYSTNAEVLEKLKDESPVVEDILEYRKLTKLHSTYAVGLSAFIADDGRIHGHFNQAVTATGRISSTDPNLQNIPMRTELGRAIRKVFLPKKGAKFVDADYSQIELRILAHVSGDEHLINAYKEGRDIHQDTASKVFNIPYDEVGEGDRRNAKAVNFGIVYGISAHGLSEDLKISRSQAKDYIEQYYATYPKIKEYLDREVSEGYDSGMVKTVYGRIRPIPELKSSNFNMRNFGERVAMNSPIQGTAADIMKLAMVRTAKGILDNHLKSRMVLSIHDEIVIEAYDDEIDIVKSVLSDAMSKAASLSVDLDISMSVGDTWYEAK